MTVHEIIDNREALDLDDDDPRLTPEQAALVADNIGLVGFTLSRYRYEPPKGSIFDEDDLYQTACLGLMKAARNFKPERGVAFSTYAVLSIRGVLWQFFRYYHAPSRFQQQPPLALDGFIPGSDEITWRDRIADRSNFTENVTGIVRMPKAIGELSERERLVLDMYAAGVKQTEIAQMIGVSQAQVSRILRGMRRRLTRDDVCDYAAAISA